MSLIVEDRDRIRTLTLNRPDALNAFNEELYDAAAEALFEANADDGIAVVVITGSGRAFSAGQDLLEMHQIATDPDFKMGKHGFMGFTDALVALDKPLIVAVNGLGLGIGATILGYADLSLMSTKGRLKCPFTSLGVAPEAGSSYTFPRLLGHQNAAWMLMSSEWIGPEEALRMGLVRELCAPEELMDKTRERAETLARLPISSLVAVKQSMLAPHRDAIDTARRHESSLFERLMGSPANLEALTAFAEGREPDFTNLPPVTEPR
jgi:enoyl-CoA hydratase/carnithine racemase